MLKACFLNNCPEESSIFNLLCNELIGVDQIGRLRGRYYDMRMNFDNVVEDDWNKYPENRHYIFSKGLTPYKGYKDTASIPIPVTHKYFGQLRDKFIADNDYKGAVLALDLPIWFNLKDNPRIMIIAQDPLRNPKWYHDCKDAVCSTPFGLHGFIHRKKGGKRFNILVNALVEAGYGLYLTDAYKFFLRGWTHDEKKAPVAKLATGDTFERYKSILQKEIGIINPDIILSLGRAAQRAVNSFIGYDSRILNMVHFSGAAQGSIIKAYFTGNEPDHSIAAQAMKYVKHIEAKYHEIKSC